MTMRDPLYEDKFDGPSPYLNPDIWATDKGPTPLTRRFGKLFRASNLYMRTIDEKAHGAWLIRASFHISGSNPSIYFNMSHSSGLYQIWLEHIFDKWYIYINWKEGASSPTLVAPYIIATVSSADFDSDTFVQEPCVMFVKHTYHVDVYFGYQLITRIYFRKDLTPIYDKMLSHLSLQILKDVGLAYYAYFEDNFCYDYANNLTSKIPKWQTIDNWESIINIQTEIAEFEYMNISFLNLYKNINAHKTQSLIGYIASHVGAAEETGTHDSMAAQWSATGIERNMFGPDFKVFNWAKPGVFPDHTIYHAPPREYASIFVTGKIGGMRPDTKHAYKNIVWASYPAATAVAVFDNYQDSGAYGHVTPFVRMKTDLTASVGAPRLPDRSSSLFQTNWHNKFKVLGLVCDDVGFVGDSEDTAITCYDEVTYTIT